MKRMLSFMFALLAVTTQLIPDPQWTSYDGVKITLGSKFETLSEKLGKFQSRSYVDIGGEGIYWKNFYEYRYFNNKLIIWVSGKTNTVFSIICYAGEKISTDSNGIESGELLESISAKMKPYFVRGGVNYLFAEKKDKELGDIKYMYSADEKGKVKVWWMMIKYPPVEK